MIKKKIIPYLSKNSAKIWTGIAIGGAISSIALATDATVKATRVVEFEKLKRISERENIIEISEVIYDSDSIEEVTKHLYTPTKNILEPKEIFLMTWKYYIPTVAMATVTVGAIIFGNKAHNKKYLALMSLYKVAESTIEHTNESIMDIVGDKKAKEIKDKVAEKVVDKKTKETKEAKMTENIIDTGNGTMLCFDSLSGRYFRSDVESIRSAQNSFNTDLIHGYWGSLNDLYDHMSLPAIDLGDLVGWNTANMVELHFTSMLGDRKEPCLVISHMNEPTMIFRD